MRLSVRHGVDLIAVDKFSRAVDRELDAGKGPALLPGTCVSPDNRIPHDARVG